MADDVIVDQFEIEIDEAVHPTAVQAAPLATDLRLITMTMKISNHLERVSDEATTIARRSLELSMEPQLKPYVDIPRMASMALDMLKEALDSFVNRNPEKGARPSSRATRTCGPAQQAIAPYELSSYMVERPSTITRCLNLMVISKSLERVADHAANVAEEVVYLYEARDIRHTGKSAPASAGSADCGTGNNAGMKKFAAEFFGTFALVFAGTGAIVIDHASGGAVSHVGVALTFGLVVLAMIYAVGDISGAHLNPAVTLGFFAARRFEARLVLPYVLSQCAGALAASGVLRVIFPGEHDLGATHPAGSAMQSFVLGSGADVVVDAGDSQRVRGREGKRHHRGNCHRFGDCAGGVVCGADLRGVHESGAVAGAGGGGDESSELVDLFNSAGAGRTRWPCRSAV